MLSLRYDPGAGHLVTMSQFFFIACHGLIFTSKFFTVKPVIQMRDYVALVVMYFVTSICSNYAFNFNIPMPLHMIFKAGSLMANMVMGIFMLKKRYDGWKYLSVMMITVGIIICTITSGSRSDNKDDDKEDDSYGFLFWWLFGITLLTVALFVAAMLGVYQEKLFTKYGKHPYEALFFAHLFPLPVFLLLFQNIIEHAKIALDSKPFTTEGIQIPWMVICYVGNMLTQHLCIRSVYVLMAECPSLTVTLVLTLRKFTSLLFSIFFFRNPFTVYHWIGTLMVFTGTLIFTEVFPKVIVKFTSEVTNSADKFTLAGYRKPEPGDSILHFCDKIRCFVKEPDFKCVPRSSKSLTILKVNEE